MPRVRTRQETEAQYSRVRTMLAQRTPNPSVGLGSVENMGPRIAELYARATRGYASRVMRYRSQSRGNSAT